MSKAKIPATQPAPIALKVGQEVYWCACGRSKSQPFCDSSHEGTGFQPLKFEPEKNGKYFFCQCKRTAKPPFCDGSHKSIAQEERDAAEGLRRVWYKVADPEDMLEGEVRTVQAGAQDTRTDALRRPARSLRQRLSSSGGPLGEGSIEDCWLRCPWHGWNFHPHTGKSAAGSAGGVSVYPLEERDDGVYVQIVEERERLRTISDVMVETMVNWGVSHASLKNPDFAAFARDCAGFEKCVERIEDLNDALREGLQYEGPALVEIRSNAELI